ncbi:hypothetical protein RUND412_009433 [Rhizina undulata]
MEGLPAEILQEIVGHLSTDDLDSVRLVNHELSAAANVFKYRTLRVPVSRKGLDHLYVSQQPALANCVREIFYPWGHLPPVAFPASGDLTEYNLPLWKLMKVIQKGYDFVKWYNKMYTTQTELEDSGESVAALEAALSRMSNIRVLQPGFCLDHPGDEFDKWRGTLTGTGSGNNDIDWNLIKWDYVIYPKSTKDCEARVTKHILDLINVSYRVGLKPHGIGSITGESPNLTSLTFLLYEPEEFGNYVDARGFKKMFEEGRLQNFLSSATNLQYLSLGLGLSNSLDLIYSFSLLDIFGHTRIWKYLRTFDFISFNTPINVMDLANLLRSHSETLETLSLNLETIFGGTCRELLDILKEKLHLTKFDISFNQKRFLNDEKPYFDKLWDQTEAYVLHGGPGFPPTEMELEEERLNSSDEVEAHGYEG